MILVILIPLAIVVTILSAKAVINYCKLVDVDTSQMTPEQKKAHQRKEREAFAVIAGLAGVNIIGGQVASRAKPSNFYGPGVIKPIGPLPPTAYERNVADMQRRRLH